MRIISAEVVRAGRFVCVRLRTDDGHIGLGEAHPGSGTAGRPVAVVAALEELSSWLLGHDPTPIERIWQELYRRQVFRGGPDAMAALSAIDIALWDIRGRTLGVPLYELLGGPVRDRIRAYVHVAGTSPHNIAEAARQRAAEGYTAVRMYPFGSFDAGVPNRLDRLVETARAFSESVRDAIGPDVDLIIDAVCRLRSPEALALARALVDVRPLYLEDPIEPDNIPAIVALAERSDLPIVTGERSVRLADFRLLLHGGNLAGIRPDPSAAGGVTQIRKIASLAESANADVIIHNPLGPVLTACALHLEAALYPATLHEHVADPTDLISRAFRGSHHPEHGFFRLPAGPGLGIELDDEALRGLEVEAYQRGPVHDDDGRLRDY